MTIRRILSELASLGLFMAVVISALTFVGVAGGHL